jgi:hypothetical protein
MSIAHSPGMKRSLQIILGVALFGAAFSGYLTLREFSAPAEAAYTCQPVGAPGTVLGYPACVYGFFMYLAIAVVASVGLWLGRTTPGGGRGARHMVTAAKSSPAA